MLDPFLQYLIVPLNGGVGGNYYLQPKFYYVPDAEFLSMEVDRTTSDGTECLTITNSQDVVIPTSTRRLDGCNANVKGYHKS